jgi:3-oxoacyl-[acyl-carrier protein] reductase
MDLGIAGRKAIVCASSRGLGKGCAWALAEAGVHLTINGRDEAALSATADELRAAGAPSVTAINADLSSSEGRAAVLAACPNPDILVNNNGGPPLRGFRDLDPETIVDGVNMNMVTPIELIRATIDHMTGQGFGRIVNITSISVKMPIAGLDLSSGARAGLTAFLAGVCREVAGHGVTINHLLPGFFDTSRLRSGITSAAAGSGRTEEEIATERAAMVPAGRFGTAEEFGKACAFLSSVHAGYITGQSILLDGGLYRSAF